MCCVKFVARIYVACEDIMFCVRPYLTYEIVVYPNL